MKYARKTFNFCAKNPIFLKYVQGVGPTPPPVMIPLLLTVGTLNGSSNKAFSAAKFRLKIGGFLVVELDEEPP